MAGPSGEEQCTHHMVPVSPQCPQETVLLTLPPPVLQGTAVSSERISQHPPGNVAALGGSLPRRMSLEQLVRLSPAGPPLATLSTSEVSLERLIPIVDFLAAWKLLPNVSEWVLQTEGSGNGTGSKHSTEEGGHRGGPSSRRETVQAGTSLFQSRMGIHPEVEPFHFLVKRSPARPSSLPGWFSAGVPAGLILRRGDCIPL